MQSFSFSRSPVVASPTKRVRSNTRTPSSRISDLSKSNDSTISRFSPKPSKPAGNKQTTQAQPPSQPNVEEILKNPSANSQIIDFVKKTASYYIQALSYNYPDIKNQMRNAHSKFFQDFNCWIRNSGKISQRKRQQESVSSIRELESTRENMQTNLGDLHKELSVWRSVNTNVETDYFVKIDKFDDNFVLDQAEFRNHIAVFLTNLDALSLSIHRGEISIENAKRRSKELCDYMITTLPIDQNEKIKLSQMYPDVV
ncbi:hypothetical protein TVAG_442900 [Trichomonas vaginalis G3]|uniref:Uncharacterized protein n=1 Tax=Trichomonas vaginalis (strain ATCC PRA-98 / G3) TaxID=412133 RepID=A2FT41_TRIV3|nr:hypothetical protein TVAGG3_0806470 [Trichomonas vaginalis G3]EAX91917.1 hypothetical protein TVAG_442900 [Trichomonas vaginalis G3]KAI5496899.1 hypothetical protein TVAGG3_0806470 [Trichomonas vaginalis G3]|eukprot:XP_001304847.1 hypothetical protein [Trichomonas vaginalis G3]